MPASRKWNDVGGLQLSVIQWLASKPRTKEYIVGRLGRSRYHHRVIPTLVTRRLIHEVDGLFYPTDHGKAVLLPPDQCRQWRQNWGMA